MRLRAPNSGIAWAMANPLEKPYSDGSRYWVKDCPIRQEDPLVPEGAARGKLLTQAYTKK